MRFKDNKAIYLQIADLICDDILQGERQHLCTCLRLVAKQRNHLHETRTWLLRISGRKDRHPADETRGVHE